MYNIVSGKLAIIMHPTQISVYLYIINYKVISILHCKAYLSTAKRGR